MSSHEQRRRQKEFEKTSTGRHKNSIGIGGSGAHREVQAGDNGRERILWRVERVRLNVTKGLLAAPLPHELSNLRLGSAEGDADHLDLALAAPGAAPPAEQAGKEPRRGLGPGRRLLDKHLFYPSSECHDRKMRHGRLEREQLDMIRVWEGRARGEEPPEERRVPAQISDNISGGATGRWELQHLAFCLPGSAFGRIESTFPPRRALHAVRHLARPPRPQPPPHPLPRAVDRVPKKGGFSASDR